MSRITSGDSRPAKGRARQAELAEEMKHAVAVNSAAMLKGLGRPYSLAEQYVAEAISSLFLRAARLRAGGRDDTAVLRQAAELQQGSVFACRHPAAIPLPLIDPAAETKPV
jgi:hypothetical protein